MAGSSGKGEDLGGGYSLTTWRSWSKYECFGTYLVQRQGTPKGRNALPCTLQQESATHCSEIPCAFGLLAGVSREPLIWRFLVQSIYSESSGSHSSPCPGTPSATPALSAPPSHPGGLARAPVRSAPHAAARSLEAQDLVVWAPWTAAYSSNSEGWRSPSLNLDAIRGNQPKTLRQLLPQDYSQSAKDIRVIIQSLDF